MDVHGKYNQRNLDQNKTAVHIKNPSSRILTSDLGITVINLQSPRKGLSEERTFHVTFPKINSEDSLLKPNNLTHHGEQVTEEEELSPTLENLIVLTWLRLIHPSLPRLVKQRYGTELRSRTLASIKPEISQALSSLLEEIRTSDDAKILRSAVSNTYQWKPATSHNNQWKPAPNSKTTSRKPRSSKIPLSRDSLKYCGVATPFRGVRVYTRCAMGMPGSETALEELMCRVLGDLLAEGVVVKLADDLYCGGNTPHELFSNWKRTLQALHECNLRLSASKTIINPKTTTILGWIWSAGTLKASPHRVATLAQCPTPTTVGLMRSFIGAYKPPALPTGLSKDGYTLKGQST
ncbi:predicted protein [Nematostella vectensis]|uniref:Reverse transcriptase domain-containing protein n=1 Tax=Nematostella vectensis TaxID=45351 RepID=A7ST86_NEMVE|nr:predicted protein [Nematostella vectensis]|eukprot:XP_001625190.1 predicted protein [Nematostella vectensis]